MFIVLRKKKLIFLHWYHHTTALIITWYAYKDMVAGGGWLGVLNYSVHAIMYSYYAVRAAGFQLSRLIAITITLIQMLQMLIYVVINIFIFYWKEDKVCHTTWTMLFLSFIIYTSLLILFCNFLFLFLQICYQPFEILIPVPKQQARKSFTDSSKLPQKWEKHSHLTIWTTTVSAPAHDCWGSDPSLLISEGRSQLHPTGDGTPLTPPAGRPVPTGLVAAVPCDLACTIPCQHRTQCH